MLRRIPALLLALIAGPSIGQMMGAPMSTTQYFPLVDGARHEYVFASGPRMTAVAVMHAGQNWAGSMQLTSVHTTSLCKPATPCTTDTTDFYRMDPDGLHYFGGDGRSPDDFNYMMSLMSPEWLIKNPVSVGDMMGPGMGYQNAEMWQTMVSGTNTMMGPQNYMSGYRAQALETVTTPAGTFVNALHVREERGSGYVRDVWYAPGVGMVRWMDNQEEALLSRITLPTGPVPLVARAVEYYHAGLDHYFMTADAMEIAALDGGRFQGWQRTGMSFNVVDPAVSTPGMANPVCRYYGMPAYGLDTHFYTASPDECEAVHQKWPNEWLLESTNAFQIYMPDQMSGACPTGTLALFRTWNGRVDTNHRYTMDPGVQTMMMGKGNIAEGYGNPAVIMCSPQ